MLPVLTVHPEGTVKTPWQPWQVLVLILAGWVNRRQQDAIAYLWTENRILREKLGTKRVLLNDEQRRRLAVKGKILGRRMLQVARNVTDAEEGFLHGKKYLLMDRDGKFSDAFRATLEQAGVEAVRLPPRSPNLNPHLERFVGSIKTECLDRMIFFGEKSLQAATVS